MNFRFLILFLMMVLAVSSYAQRTEEQLLRIVREDKKDTVNVEALLELGRKIGSNNFEKSRAYFERAKLISESLNYNSGRISAINALGASYISSGDYEIALEYHQLVLAETRQLEDYENQIIALTNIAITHGSLGDTEKALQFFREALQLAKTTNSPSYGTICSNIGYAFDLLQDYDSSLYYNKLAIKISLENDNIRSLTNGLINLASSEYNLGRYNDALYHLDSALVSANQAGYQVFEVVIQIEKARVLNKMDRGEEAIQLLMEYLAVAEEKAYKQQLLQGYEYLSDILLEKGRGVEALEAYKKRNYWEKEIFNNEKIKQIEQLKSQYELELKQNEIDIQNLKLAKQNNFILILSAIAIITFILAMITYYYFLTKSRANKKLKVLNRQISEHEQELIVQSERLERANEEIRSINENLESIIEERTKRIQFQNEKLLEFAFLSGHKLRGPLARILGLLNLVNKHSDGEIEINKLLKDLELQSNDMDQVISEMNRAIEKEDTMDEATKDKLIIKK